MKKHLFPIASFLIVLATSSPALTNEVVLLWPDTPGLNAPDGMGNEVEKRGKAMLIGVETPHLTIYEAPNSTTPTPAILLTPGGGYKRLVTSLHQPIAAWFQEQGIRPFMLAYRCPVDRKNPEAAVQDMQRAIRMLRANAKEWNIDPNRIGVLGSSAGGNLAVRASVFSKTDATDQLSSKPDFTILLYPAWVGHRGTGGLSKWVEVRPDYGPTFITAARDDKHFGSSPPYEHALEAAGVPVRTFYFDQGGHGFGLREPADIATWPEACLSWLKEVGVFH